MREHRRNLLAENGNPTGVVLFLIGILCMSIMDAAVKLLTDNYSVMQLILMESIFGSITLAVILVREGSLRLHSQLWGILLLRAMLTLGTMAFFFAALETQSLAQVTMLFMTSPLLVLIFSAILLGEGFTVQQLAGVGLGAVGACFILSPSSFSLGPEALLPLGAATCSALGLTASRFLTRTETASRIMFYEIALLLTVSAVWLSGDWPAPATADIPLIAIMGIMGALTVYLRTLATSYTDLGRLAPFEYTGMIWAIVFGVLIWAEFPDGWSLLGASLIAAGGILGSRSAAGQITLQQEMPDPR